MIVAAFYRESIAVVAAILAWRFLSDLGVEVARPAESHISLHSLHEGS